MRCSTIAVLGLAAVARATWDGQFTYPPGIEPLAGNGDFNIKTFGPATGPPSDCISVWHPPHPDVYIDECDSDKDHGWHWVHPGKPKWGNPGKGDKTKTKDNGGHDKTKDHDKPEKTKQPGVPSEAPNQPEQPAPTSTPQWKWTTSTITQTAVSTIFSCPPSVPNCPGGGEGGTKYKTVTVPAIVTICPVPVNPNPAPTTAPVANPPAPPVTTAKPQPPATQPAATPVVPIPPNTLTSVAVPSVKPSSAPVVAPPATTVRPSDVGTVTRPNPTATTSRAVVTAGAVPNVQRAGGVVVAVAAAAAVFI